MVAMLAFGGTFAYFTATASDATGSVETGKIALNVGNVATISAGYAVSGQELLDTSEGVTVALNQATNVSTWVFVTFTATFAPLTEGAVDADNNKTDEVTSQMEAADIEALFTEDGDYALVYGVETGTGSWTEVKGHTGVYAFLVEYDEDGTLADDSQQPPMVCDSILFYGRSTSNTEPDNNEDGKDEVTLGALMGGTITVTLTTDAVQAHGFADDADLNTGKTAAQKAYESIYPVTQGSGT